MTIAEKLRAPFPADCIEWRIGQEKKDGSGAMVLAYLTARAVQDRLDDVFGWYGWKVAHEPCERGVITQISALTEGSEWISKSDGAEWTDIEGWKGGLSGGLKRAAVLFGIGRYLYDLPPSWVEFKPRGEHYHKPGKCWDSPRLPAEFLPGGPKPVATTHPSPRTQEIQGGEHALDWKNEDPLHDAERVPDEAFEQTFGQLPQVDDDQPPACPKCDGAMYDNAKKKRDGTYKATAPDFACKDKQCGHKIWPEKK